MSLSLKIISVNGEPITATAIFFNEGGSIGRASTNTLVLPDPEKFVSRQHAVIRKENEQYILQDVSLSGTFINDEKEALKKKTRVLTDGMRLRIANYEILVSLSGERFNFEKTDFFNENASQSLDSNAPNFLDTVEPVLDEENELHKLLENPVQEASPFTQAPEMTTGSLSDVRFSPLQDSFIPPAPLSNSQTQVSEDLNSIPDDFNFEELFNNESPQTATANDFPEISISASALDKPVNLSSPFESSPQTQSQLFDSFLEGLSIEAKELKIVDAENTLKRAGMLLRKFVTGTVLLLRSRTEFKNMFRVGLTHIQMTDNNALKFTSSTDETLIHLIGNNSDSIFKDSVAAIDEGFDDLITHQIAIQAGVQAAMQAALKKFDPVTIDHQYEDSLLVSKKSKCWEHYVKQYPELVEQAMEDFFGEEFAKAYEKQVQELKAQKRG